MNELMTMYDVDGFFTNSWPQVENAPHLCFCENCRKLGNLSVKQVSEQNIQKALVTIKLLNSTARKKSAEIVYNVNIAGGIGAIQDLKKVADLSEWITTDHQGRGGNTAIWDCAQQGKVAYAVTRGKPVTNVVGIKTGPWRNTSNSEAETTLWMAQTTSSGMIPWIVCLGAELPVEMNNVMQEKGNPALIVREKGSSRLVYFPNDIDKNVWTRGSVDMSRLLQQSIRWLIKDNELVTVEGEGYIEIIAWETEPGFALHLLNYNNPNMTKASIRKTFPIGEQRVRMTLPDGVRIAKAELLRAGKALEFKQEGNKVSFVVSSIGDFEIAALYKA